MIAAAYADGYFKIFSLSSLESGNRLADIKLSNRKLTCLSWNKNIYDPITIVVGIGPPNSSSRSSDRNIIGSSRLSKSLSPKRKGKISIEKDTYNEDDMNCLKLIYKNDKSNWEQLCAVEHFSLKHTQGVRDVSWANLNGRSYHTIVSCGDEGVFVWRFKILKGIDGKPKVVFLDAKTFGIENSIPIRCSWNFMATLITVTSRNSEFSIWKKYRYGDWERIFIGNQKDKEITSYN